MQVDTDVSSIDVEVRCSKCDYVMSIYEQYEYRGRMMVTVDPCEECEDESD